MSDEPDYKDILDQNVREVKKSLRELSNPDWDDILELEKDNKDRKTVKEFVQDRLDELGEEVEEAVEESTDEVEEEIDESAEEVAPYISKDTEGGLLGSFSPAQLLTGGVLLGVVVGLLVGLGMSSGGAQASPAQVENSVQQLFTASGVPAENIEFVQTEMEHGMYHMQVNVTQGTGNQTQTSTREFYVSSDAELLFPVVNSPFIQTPINIQDTLQRIQQQRQQQQQNQTQNTTQ